MNWYLILFIFIADQGNMQKLAPFETQGACEDAGKQAVADLRSISQYGAIRVYWVCARTGEKEEGR